MNQYALDILSCPTDPSATGSTMYITYSSPTKLSAVKGADEILSYDLKNFYVPVDVAQKTTIRLPAHTETYLPIDNSIFDFCGINSGKAVFCAFFPQYSSDDKTTHFIQWSQLSSLEAQTQGSPSISIVEDDIQGEYVNDYVTDYFSQQGAFSVRHERSIMGKYIGFVSDIAYILSTEAGGIKLYSKSDGMKLINTYNSDLASNVTYASAVDINGSIWVATDSGISKLTYYNSAFTVENFNTNNSQIISNKVFGIEIYNNEIVLCTDKGINIFDHVNRTWSKFSKLNINEICANEFYAVKKYENYLVFCSDNGAYVFNRSINEWVRYDSTTPGWSGSNTSLAIDVIASEVFIGTSNKIYTFTIGDTSVVPITVSHNNITSLIYDNIEDKLYVVFLDGHISRYDINTSLWDYDVNSLASSYFMSSDFIMCNEIGFSKFNKNTGQLTQLPENDENGDILFVYPLNQMGNVSINQSIYTIFSKPVDLSVFNTHLTGLSATNISVANGYCVKSTPMLSFSTEYNYVIEEGLTATDNTYFKQSIDINFYTEDKTPVSGWQILGKQLVLSGTTEYPITSIVFRNPQDYEVEISAIVAY